MTDSDLVAALSAPGRPNPHAEQADQRYWRWLDSLGLCRSEHDRTNMLETQVGYCMGLYYPDAPLDTLTFLCKIGGWAEIIDEDLDAGPAGREPAACLATITGILSAFHEPAARPGRTALEAAAAELWGELAPQHSTAWRTRFLTHMTHYLWGHYTSCIDHAVGREQRLTEYHERRREIFAVPWLLQLCEVTAGADLPDAVHRLPAFRELFTAVSDVAYLDNDRVSVERELATGVQDNSFFLLRRQEGLSAKQAMARIERMIAAHDERIATAHHELPPQLEHSALPGPVRAAALRCADGYLDFTRGHRWYCATAARYQSAAAPGTV